MSQISELEKNEIYMQIDKRFHDYMKARVLRIDKDSYKYELFNILAKTVIEPAGFRIEHFRGYTAQEKIEKTLYCCRKIGLDQFNTESVLFIWSDDALKLVDI
ncbi:hypothetical protein RMB03_19595 [Acinetobacter sp. V91_7]|uniref:hypothetical protein n=1 Tax=Acinetobacter TaxID=469 RepID=UPI0022731618|nr:MULTISPECIES: hypothetical protein [Acinetobacter]MDS7930097.1 hypothetical protein [Acinetobacter sp. V102_4]MDS7933547.1 hypothetical protein [Acinetobacter sp. V91_4B]MDS7965151.1 hypothetical protein [Acinetobacter sp. V91_7]MDS8027642.1 hypothetical protein [Acinetobacter sp. V91_13]GLG83627.1 hypothetical protein ACSO1_21490 [Acinetobacter calcoaceticus]